MFILQPMANNGAARARNWCFTLQINEWTNWSDQAAAIEAHPSVRGWIYQLEEAETGQLHLQGYVEFTDALRFNTVRAIAPSAHWETRKGTREQCIDYCRKTETRIDGPWFSDEQFLEATGQGKRSDLDRAVALLGETKSLKR